MNLGIKRGYEILPNNDVVFGIRITNNSDLVISDVQVILDYNESLFKLQGDRVLKLGNIPPTIARTAKFTLKPLGCVHKERIEASITHRDPKWEKHIVNMRPKEVHCVCPFLRAKPMTKNEFIQRLNSGYNVESGMNFEGINAEQITAFLMQTCGTRLYIVDGYTFAEGNVLYFSSESIGENTYYLLTALIKENEGLTQVMLRAVSDKTYGIHGFLNEIVSEISHLVNTINSAREIGVIKNEQVINIIDSVVQRSNLSAGNDKSSINIDNSVVQRTNISQVQNSAIKHSNNNEPNTPKEQPVSSTTNQNLQDEDVERMYEKHLKEIRNKKNNTEVKRESSSIPYSRNPVFSNRKIDTLRSTTPPPKKEVNPKTKKRRFKKLIMPILFIAILAIAANYLLENPEIEETISARYQISTQDYDAVESTVITFINSVNDGDFNTAFNMYQGKDFLAVASIKMIFENRGIEPGSIGNIEVLSTDIGGPIAVVSSECTVTSSNIAGNEMSTSVIPIYFQLKDSELGWIITRVSFNQPLEIEAVDTIETVVVDSEEERAQYTGKQTTQEVSSNLMVKTIEGVRAKRSSTDMSNTIDLLKLKVGLNVGSSPVDVNQVVISITDGTTANNLVYAGNMKAYASAGNSDGYMDSFSSSASTNLATLLGGTTTTSSTLFKNPDHYYTVEKIRDEDASFSQSNPVMNTGDLITVYIATTSNNAAASYSNIGLASVSAGLKKSGLNLVPRTTVNIVLTPESGAATTADFVTPSSYGVKETVQLYP